MARPFGRPTGSPAALRRASASFVLAEINSRSICAAIALKCVLIRVHHMDGGLSLQPSLEVGLRRDGGDAETGAGVDIGGGLIVSDALTGLSADFRVRMLLAHHTFSASSYFLARSEGCWRFERRKPSCLSKRA